MKFFGKDYVMKSIGKTKIPFTLVTSLIGLAIAGLALPAFGDQTVSLKGDAGGPRFDGVGAVSGGGATSVLLKDYPEPQRSQVLDLLFKPKFGASMLTLLVEVPGDSNSTQGAEPSHMHTQTDENYYRGYEWWIMAEAKKRNPAITLDACAWGFPAWVGNGQFWSQDMADYYVKWIKGLKSEHGLDLDAIGTRNEKGVSIDFIKKLKTTLNANGLQNVKVHGFDNWQKDKWNWIPTLLTDEALRNSVDAVSNHTIASDPAPAEIRKQLESMNKPIWNTEEHVYKDGFDCEISLVQAFNENFLRSGVTKIVNWYLVASVYPVESYPEQPSAMIANSPWSGHYATRPNLWGYAHYGQFVKVGWHYLNDACGNLSGGGTFVTFKSPETDYSIIAQTKDAKAPQTLTFNISNGLSTGKLCVWRSNAAEQFVRQPDITPADGTFTITLDPQCIYSISTTTGQQKGTFPDVPAAKPFPLPYYETFDHYADAKSFGYLPHYTADIVGIFEIADRPDSKGKCMRQVIDKRAQSWAPEWMPYTILGDQDWKDYEVSADILLESGGSAGVMGRVNNVGTGYGTVPKAYYFRVSSDGTVALFAAKQGNNAGAGTQLATAKADNFAPDQWHNVKLRFSGTTLTAFVDDTQMLTLQDTLYTKGMAGFVVGDAPTTRITALFDNLLVTPLDGTKPKPTDFPQDKNPLYRR